MHRLFFVLLAACALPNREVRAPADQALNGLFVQTWRPEGEVRGVVVIHHGLADHGARYDAFAKQLAARGYAVTAHDMRGHARSSGRRVTIDRIDTLVDDLDAVVERARARDPGVPVFVVGHSLGGLVTSLYAIERQPALAGIVLSAPGLAFDVPAFGIGAIRFVAAIAPNAPILDTPHADFSSSADVVADMKRDPLIETPKGPARTSRAATDGVRRVWAHPERLAVPLLAVHGTADKIVAPIASRDLVARAGTQDRTLRLYDGLQHDLLHEPAGAQVANDIVAWLDAHVDHAAPPFPSAPHRTLRGDRRAMSLAVELDARGEHTDDVDGATGGLRLRLGVGRIGYTAGLDLRAGYLDGAWLAADLHALGLGIRAGNGASLALTAGGGARRAAGTTTLSLPVEAALELPLGPVHVMARGGVAITDDDTEVRALLGLRLGRDARYWPRTVAGAGPFIAGTYQNIEGVDVVGVAIGGQLWGGN